MKNFISAKKADVTGSFFDPVIIYALLSYSNINLSYCRCFLETISLPQTMGNRS